MKSLRIIGIAVAAVLVTVFAATSYFRPRLEKQISEAVKSGLQRESLRVESITASWRKVSVRMYGSNAAKVKKVYELVSTTPGVRSVHVETLPVRDPFLNLQVENGKVVVRGLLSNQALGQEIANWTGQGVQVAPDVREDPLETTVLELVQLWSQSKAIESVMVGFDTARLRVAATFNAEEDLASTALILKSQTNGRIEKKLVLNKLIPDKAPEETATRSVAQSEVDTGAATETTVPADAAATARVLASMGGKFPQIRFAFSEQTESRLKELASALKADPNLRIRVMGFTDNHGDPRFNYYLSKKRAAQVAGLLMEAGVSENSIVVEGRGPTEFIADNSTLAGRKINRRVEFELLRKG
jgi:outer membrane protein OmpA-like peptidoglycan-associated protein